MLRFSDLSDYEKRLIHEEVAKDVRVKTLSFTTVADEQVYDGALVDVLAEWGVMCNHPESSAQRSENERRYFVCGVCDAIVLSDLRPRPQAKLENE